MESSNYLRLKVIAIERRRRLVEIYEFAHGGFVRADVDQISPETLARRQAFADVMEFVQRKLTEDDEAARGWDL